MATSARPPMQHRRILVAATGLTPQILTETLYALAVARTPAWVPDEIHVLTTTTGAESLRLNLLQSPPRDGQAPSPGRIPGLGWFHQLRRDYQLPTISFDMQRVHVIPGAQSGPLDDIRSPADNTAAADFITERLRELTSDPTTELHVSLAGGRKTMGYYLGYALSLFGRPQDHLSHVLVSEPYESNRDFWYPTPYALPIHGRRGDREVTVDAAKARVELAEIPFVRLRLGLPDGLLQGSSSFHRTVDAAQAMLAPPRLVLRPSGAGGEVQAGSTSLHLAPAPFALLALFAWRRSNGLAPLPAPTKHCRDPSWSQQALAELQQALGEFRVPDSVHEALSRGVDGDWFSQHLSRLHGELKRALGPAAASYRIDDGGKRPRRYALLLPPGSIEFIHPHGAKPE